MPFTRYNLSLLALSPRYTLQHGLEPLASKSLKDSETQARFVLFLSTNETATATTVQVLSISLVQSISVVSVWYLLNEEAEEPNNVRIRGGKCPFLGPVEISGTAYCHIQIPGGSPSSGSRFPLHTAQVYLIELGTQVGMGSHCCTLFQTLHN